MSWPIGISLAAVGLAAVAALLWLGWWRFPKRHVDRLRLSVRDPKARADIEDNLRKTIGQLIGGFAVLIGAGFAYLQFTQQQQTSQQQFSQQQQTSQQQFSQQRQAAQQLLVSNQVAKGFEQLGSNKIVVRLGGIYALEGVMNNSEQYHQPVLEALSAFVRDDTRTGTGGVPPASDIQAALTVIGRRAEIGTGVPDLADAHIPKTALTGANLTGANLSRTDLTGADLTDAHLPGANLAVAQLGGANMFRANLTGAHLDFAYLNSAHLSDANLTDADLRDADLLGAYLRGANLTGAHLSANLTDADLTGANLTDAQLFRANLTDADLRGATLRGANLTDAILSGATVSQTQLDTACGTNVKLDAGLTIKPCP